MPRVYISSTYKDLKAFREKAASAVLAFEGQTVKMEDYVAQDERPLDKCVQDVKSCDIYLGIIAKRYGFRPPDQPNGEEKSITELEYEAAAQKARLIFFLADDVDWPDEFTDSGQDREALEAFKSTVQLRHLGKPFTSPENLETVVSQALGKLLIGDRGALPELLPYLSDRSDQAEVLKKALAKHRSSTPARPFLIVIHGDENEAHTTFRRRLRKRVLPRLLGHGEDDAIPHEVVIPWSDSKASVDRRLGQLSSRMMTELAGSDDPMSIGALRDAVIRKAGSLMVTTSVLSADWQSNEESLIRQWLKWWGSWPKLPPDRLLAVVVAVHYETAPKGGRWTKFLPRRGGKREKAIQAVKELDPDSIGGLSGVVLPRLEGVSRTHIRSWFDTHVKEFCEESPGKIPPHTVLESKIMPRIREIFDDREVTDEEGRIAMGIIEEKLYELLEESLIKGDG